MIIAGYSPRISSISLYLAGDDDILEAQVVKIITHESFQAGEKPVPGGFYDPRMGAIASFYNCSTCGYNDKQCPGHFGYYALDHTLIQPVIIEDVIKWLKIVCIKCGNLLIDIKKIADIPSSKKLQVAAQTQLIDRVCSKCGAVHPKFKHNEDNLFYINLQSSNEIRTMYIDDIRAVFEKISDETCLQMGRSLKSHPRKYFTRYLPMPPITMRPYYKNALTNKSHRVSPTMEFLKNMVRKNNLQGNTEQMLKNELFINKINFDMIRGGSQKKGDVRTNNIIGGPLADAIIKQLGGKKGLIRNFQMAHRALSGSRITISGNPTLEVDEVGIPKFVVKTLQVSETVREWNINLLNEDIVSGRCSRVRKIETGNEHSINEYNKNDIILEHGDVVFRYIRKGDMCIFNRPPSLKESAIGSHRAVPFEYGAENTFQTNVAVCVNYNADYDGDTMRLKVLRTLRAITESKYISPIERWMLSSQKSICVNGQVQDSVVGSALMTRTGVVFDKLHAMRLFSKAGILNIQSFNKKEYTGREIISMLLNDTPISYKGKAKYYNSAYKNFIDYKDEDINVIIKKGVVQQGILDKNAIGDNSSGGVFHLIALEYGTKIALKKIFSYQQIVLKYLEMNGFTMGMDDLIISKETRTQIDRIVSDQELKSKLFAEEMSRGEIIPPVGVSLHDFYEQQQLRRLTNDTTVFGPILRSINQNTNGLFQMIMYGGKGKPTNMMSIFGYVGQLQVEGERMPPTFSPYRTSVYFPRFAMSPEAKGFVRNSLSEGLDPIIMSYAGAQARQNIVQKSQSTAVSGSNQRKHVKNMENTIVTNLRQVNKSFMILQYLYGENGFDPRNLVKIKLDTATMTISEIKEKYYYKTLDKSIVHIFDKEVQYLIDDYDQYNHIAYKLELVGLVNGFPDKMQFGIYIDSTIENIMIDKPKNDKELSEMVLMIDSFIEELPYLYLNEYQRKIKGYIPSYLKTTCFLISMLLRIKLNSNTVLVHTNKEILSKALDKISFKFMKNMISPGSCVGVMAAQSVGEPMTQMMLDAVHGSSSGASAGLEKSKEILSAKFPSNITNSMWFTLKSDISSNKLKVNNVAETIKGVKLKDFIKSFQIFLEEYGNPVHSLYKSEKNIIINFEKKNPSLRTRISKLSKWVIRLSLDKIKMMYKSISIEKIVETLYIKHNNIVIVYTVELVEDTFIRIYIMENEFLRISNIKNYLLNIYIPKLEDIVIRGIDNILDTTVQPIQMRKKNEETGNYEVNDEYIIRTTGLDIQTLSYIGDDLNINLNEVNLGSVMDTYEYYGIEAARARIIEQMISVMGR